MPQGTKQADWGGEKDEVEVEYLIEEHHDLLSRLAESDLPISRDAQRALELYRQGGTHE